jgi:GntR family transcriptional regulator
MEFLGDKSIFLQIADSITEKVVSGTYPPDEKIPSVREMAAEVGVNPNTIMRTYNELQSMQIIENKRGIGYFVKPEAQRLILDKKKTDFFDKTLPEVIQQAGLLGITTVELKNHIDQLSNRNNHENK